MQTSKNYHVAGKHVNVSHAVSHCLDQHTDCFLFNAFD